MKKIKKQFRSLVLWLAVMTLAAVSLAGLAWWAAGGPNPWLVTLLVSLASWKIYRYSRKSGR